jgi:death-on-curing protein
MKNIELEDVLIFHRKLIEQTGGSDGIRDLGLIESAINRAFMTFEGKDLYQEIEDKISAITYSLVNNHGFVDGNKRIGVAVMILLLRLNDIKINYSQKELIDLGLGIADGSLKENEIKQWIKKYII